MFNVFLKLHKKLNISVLLNMAKVYTINMYMFISVKILYKLTSCIISQHSYKMMKLC